MTIAWMRNVSAPYPGSVFGSGFRMSAMLVTETTIEASIDEISLQALIRHQYQRRMRTRPVPLPSASSNRHAPSIVERFNVTTMDARNNPTVVHRDTAT